MSYFIGIDVGGTNTVCGLVDGEGTLIRKKKIATEAHLGSEHVLNNIARIVNELLNASGIDPSSVAALGMGTPGFVDPVNGVTIFAGNLNWKQVHVAAGMRSRTGIPAYMDNDVRMYVYGEYISGAAKGFEHVLGITLGTGMAAAVINQGQLYYGGAYMAGEIGHIPAEHGHYPCGCGRVGCLETLVSARGIARQAVDLIQSGRKSILQQWFPADQLTNLTSSDVSKAYDEGDSAAIEVMNHTGKLLGRGLSYAVTLFSPDIVVIGGGAAMAGERLFAPMREELQQSLYQGYWDKLTISTAQLLDDAGVIGSAMFAKQRIGRN